MCPHSVETEARRVGSLDRTDLVGADYSAQKNGRTDPFSGLHVVYLVSYMALGKR